jgi:hypothetical protein
MLTVRANQLHCGDVIREHDWTLHITNVEPAEITGGQVVFAVAEFEFPLHRRPLERVQLVTHEVRA